MNERLSLTELQLIIRDTLYASLPGYYWVFAEIAEAKENYAGHCYLELVEKHPDELNIRAKVRAVIWNTRYRMLKSFFESTTGETLKAGIKILVRARVEYHEVYGLSLIINDIDPSFTLGDMAMKRRQILSRLEEEGVISMNKELELTMAPCRIAVISSRNAAGYQDFIRHLKENSYGYTFLTHLFEAVMQGEETEQSIISALDAIAEHSEKFDAVAIIRGGGSQSDLSWFDNYKIAYHITQFPIPVITGIGHDKDLSVADIVAFHSLKTPTAVADFLIEKMTAAEAHLMQLASEISAIVNEMISKNKDKINSFIMKIIPEVNMIISKEKSHLSDLRVELTSRGKERLFRERSVPLNLMGALRSAVAGQISSGSARVNQNRELIRINTLNMLKKTETALSSLSNSLNFLSPLNVLKRGYTLTVLDGQIVRSAGSIKPGNIIDTLFSDGKVTSSVLKKLIKKQ